MNVAVFTNPRKDAGLAFTFRLIEYILAHNCRVLISDKCMQDILGESKESAERFKTYPTTVMHENMLLKRADLVLVLGGDGTILRIAKKAALSDLLVIGINFGRIGYIAELETDELELLDPVLSCRSAQELRDDPRFSVERRMMLSCEIIHEGKTVYWSTALNDVVISKGSISKMIDLEICRDTTPIASYRADGIILSTPTGSTAYSMSAGGPLIDPSIACICAIPVCPYMSVVSSPVIFSQESCIDVVCHVSGISEAFLTVDGKGGQKLCNGDIVRVHKSKHFTNLLKIKHTDFYQVLKIKLSNQRGL